MNLALFLFIISQVLFSHILIAKELETSELNKNNKVLVTEEHGISEKDLQISKELRQALLSDNTLSLPAQNIKIITINGEVFLKGPVKSLKEQQLILAKANNISGVKKIINRIEVINKP